MAVLQPFPHLPATIDESEMRDASARSGAEARRVVESHDAGRRIDRGPYITDAGGVADDGERRAGDQIRPAGARGIVSDGIQVCERVEQPK